MKFDLNIARKLLLDIENNDSGLMSQEAISRILKENLEKGNSEEEILYHFFILKEGGFIEGHDITDSYSKSPIAIPRRLTYQGHEFLGNARNETIWNKTLNIVQEKGGSISIAVLSQLLSSVAKTVFGLS
jgi:Ca2+-binding EF-hand superfamily protein